MEELYRAAKETALAFKDNLELLESAPNILDEDGFYSDIADYMRISRTYIGYFKARRERLEHQKYLYETRKELIHKMCLKKALDDERKILDERRLAEARMDTKKFLHKKDLQKKRLNTLKALDDRRFAKEVRMDRKAFDKLCILLKNRSSYLNPRRNLPTDVGLQLAVVLEGLGSGTPYTELSQKSSVSSGTAPLFMYRFCRAINSIQREELVKELGLANYQKIIQS